MPCIQSFQAQHILQPPACLLGCCDDKSSFFNLSNCDCETVATWKSYIPTFVGSPGEKGAASVDSASYIINGKTITLNYTYIAITPGPNSIATVGRFSLPTGVTFDT